MFSKILCPLDGSSHSERALSLAIDMAKNYDAALIILHTLLRTADSAALRRFAEIEGLAKHVEPELQRLQSMSDRLGLNLGETYEDMATASRPLAEIGEYLLRDAKAEASGKGVKNIDTLLVDGDPADRILRCIEEQNIDCVVMGSRGLSDIKGLFLGSVSHKVMNRAPCTCIAVK